MFFEGNLMRVQVGGGTGMAKQGVLLKCSSHSWTVTFTNITSRRILTRPRF